MRPPAGPILSLVFPFYDNCRMLETIQYPIFRAYSAAVKTQIEILIVDDGSPAPAVDVPRPPDLPALRIYRVLEDRPWHQHGARNLGAKEAIGAWLFLCDMDHVIHGEDLELLIKILRERFDAIYTFRRLDAPDLRPKLNRHGMPHPHPNIFAIRRDRFWKIGGYDEDLTGYGTDRAFHRRLERGAPAIQLEDVAIVRYSRDLVPDASTRTLPRKEGRPPKQHKAILAEKAAAGLGPTTLAFPWTRVW